VTRTAVSRRRALIGLNLVTFFWDLGMGASMPVIPLLSYQFIPDLALAGIVTAVGGVGALFMGYLSGPLMDRFGRRGITLWGIGIRAVFSFGEGLAPTYYWLVVARFGSAIGTAIRGTGLSVITADLATQEDRGAISGGRQTLGQIGSVLGPVIGGVLWAATGDIRAPFIFNGLSKLVCFVIFLYVMQETRDPSPLSRVSSLGSPGTHQTRDQSPGTSDLIGALFSTGFAFVIYIVFLESLFKQAIINVVLPVYVQHQLGRSETDLGLIIGAIGMGSLLVALPAGVIADKWGVRTGIVAGSALTAAALLVTGLTGYVDVALALALGAGTALLFVGGQAYAIDLAPPGARGQFFGIRASASNAAILLGPLIVGGLTDRLGYAFPFLMLATFVLVSAPMALLATPRRNKAPVLRNEV